MTKYNNDHDPGAGTQWTSPGQSWAHQGSGDSDAGQTHQWQGQSGQYSAPSQSYYDPHNPQPWHQGPQFPGAGPQAKPPHRRWWFWTIIVVVLVGLIAIILALVPTGASQPDPSSDAPRNIPFAPDSSDELPETTPGEPDVAVLESGVQRSESDGSFVLDHGGTREDALAKAQDRVDSGYLHYGPGDIIYQLRSDGYQNDAIEYALNNLEVDWNEQALGVAQRMADNEHVGYSAQEIHEQLAYSNFSADETQHALDNVDIDYNEQALQALESYLDLFDDHAESEARDYMGFAGFEDAEIDYAFDSID